MSGSSIVKSGDDLLAEDKVCNGFKLHTCRNTTVKCRCQTEPSLEKHLQ